MVSQDFATVHQQFPSQMAEEINQIEIVRGKITTDRELVYKGKQALAVINPQADKLESYLDQPGPSLLIFADNFVLEIGDRQYAAGLPDYWIIPNNQVNNENLFSQLNNSFQTELNNQARLIYTLSRHLVFTVGLAIAIFGYALVINHWRNQSRHNNRIYNFKECVAISLLAIGAPCMLTGLLAWLLLDNRILLLLILFAPAIMIYLSYRTTKFN
ncbi:DUF1189 family protein [Aerococcus urinaehominis]|nr:DUF1189 family protein [Aerococcus urinaehominis]